MSRLIEILFKTVISAYFDVSFVTRPIRIKSSSVAKMGNTNSKRTTIIDNPEKDIKIVIVPAIVEKVPDKKLQITDEIKMYSQEFETTYEELQRHILTHHPLKAPCTEEKLHLINYLKENLNNSEKYFENMKNYEKCIQLK